MINNIVDWFIETVFNFDRSMFGLAGGIGPWVVPIAPALVYGHTFYAATLSELGIWSIVGGSATAIGLVVAGAMSSHTAMALQSANAPKGKIVMCWMLVAAYIILEIGGITLMDVFGGLKVVGVTVSLLTLVVYLVRSLNQYLIAFTEQKKEIEMKADQAERDEINHQRQVEARTMKLSHEEKLLKIQANRDTKIAKATASQNVSSVSRDTLSQSKRHKIILEEILANPKMNMTHLAKQLNVSRATVYRDIGEMEKSGQIKKDGIGFVVLGGE